MEKTLIPHSVFLGYVHPASVRGEFPLQVLELAMWQGNMILQAAAGSNPSNAKARNAVIEMFLASNCEWLQWIDEDCVVHPTAPQRLRTLADKYNALMASGLAVTYDPADGTLRPGAWTFEPNIGWYMAADYEEEPFWTDGVGCHFTLVHRDAYARLLPPYHVEHTVHPKTGMPMGHDLAISLRFMETEGWPGVLYCPEVLTWHVKEWKIGKNELDAYHDSHTGN